MPPEEIIPEDIFHYTKMETALEKILFEGRLRLGQMGFTNDPREFKTLEHFKTGLVKP